MPVSPFELRLKALPNHAVARVRGEVEELASGFPLYDRRATRSLAGVR